MVNSHCTMSLGDIPVSKLWVPSECRAFKEVVVKDASTINSSDMAKLLEYSVIHGCLNTVVPHSLV